MEKKFEDYWTRVDEKENELKDNDTNNEMNITNMLINPFLEKVLGYVISDDTVREAPSGKGKNTHMDILVKENGQPRFVVECKKTLTFTGKNSQESLEVCEEQLREYMDKQKNGGHASGGLGILTDGRQYRFYYRHKDIADGVVKNICNVEQGNEPDEAQVEFIKLYAKGQFDENKAKDLAEEMLAIQEARAYFRKTLGPEGELDDDLIKLFRRKITDNSRNDKLRPRIQKALRKEWTDQMALVANPQGNHTKKSDNENEGTPSNINTTDNEILAYHIIRAILAEYVDPSQIEFKDATQYFSVNVASKPFVRLYILDKGSKHYIDFYNETNGGFSHGKRETFDKKDFFTKTLYSDDVKKKLKASLDSRLAQLAQE